MPLDLESKMKTLENRYDIDQGSSGSVNDSIMLLICWTARIENSFRLKEHDPTRIYRVPRACPFRYQGFANRRSVSQPPCLGCWRGKGGVIQRRRRINWLGILQATPLINGYKKKYSISQLSRSRYNQSTSDQPSDQLVSNRDSLAMLGICVHLRWKEGRWKYVKARQALQVPLAMRTQTQRDFGWWKRNCSRVSDGEMAIARALIQQGSWGS